ncbi:LamG-like jellyroll fold domain-containing protein [Parabacteroides sp. AM08-6]|uniref:LamG-like jellyroll fold domain-containing protein n=1 Tax=Parabacteroides sp. AM08-6 TaxID=2292053 RepID=UPI000F000CDC|nr:LamG-like jellyroll fold domain-containing protein [Parabacteroides sp. AM08-6]RHJ87650.1 hypothetical protein DW103_00285 [Parabacteroides sp. AM08-6]
MKRLIAILFSPFFFIWGCVAQTIEDITLPHGFVTYSRGENYNRELCRAEIAPGMTFDEIHATERLITKKGPYGGDITSQISFDGKWVAFARSLSGKDAGSGGNNYADFGNWDIYIARVDGDLPVEPIRIAHGYFPSWGEDSTDKKEKTLYFSVHEKTCVCKIKINDKGEITEPQQIVGNIPEEGYEGFIFTAPNGQFAAYRKSGAVYTYWFEGPNKGKSILMTAGCHPHVSADSKWVYHANRHAVRSDGSARGEAGAGGLYHYGSSNDMNWFVTRTEGDNTIINKGRESWLCTLYATDFRFDTEKAVKISDMAGFIDIHVYDDRASHKAAKLNRKRHEKLMTQGFTSAPANTYKGISKEMFDKLPINKKGEIFTWINDAADSRIINSKGEFLRSCRLVPYGLAHLGKNGRMRLAGGSFQTNDQETLDAMTVSAKKQNQITLELQFVSFSNKVSGPARIASSSKDWSSRNWTIGQEGDKLILRFRTPQNGINGTNNEIELGKVEENMPYHLIISYTPGMLLWCLNGEIMQSTSLTGNLNNWENLPFIFGDEWSGERRWYGEIQEVHIYAYAFSPKQMKDRYKSSKKTLSTLLPEKSTRLKVLILENSAEPSVEQIKEQGYSRCLTTRHIRIIESENPQLPAGKELILKEWIVLGLQKINNRKKGETYTLQLVDANEHRELQNEFTVEGLSVFDLPVYYNQSIQ